MRRLVYFAGPDLFFTGYDDLRARIRDLCHELEICALFPGDSEISDPHVIFRENIAMITESHVVIANVRPFRSKSEPDSGTAFECGVAWSRNIPIVLICPDLRVLIDKVESVCGADNDGRCFGPEGAYVEDFGFPVNLMLFKAAYALVPTLEKAILVAARMPVPG